MAHLWIFIHDTDKVEEGLMELFFGLFFVGPPGNFSTYALVCTVYNNVRINSILIKNYSKPFCTRK